jgi:hypothetical protein
LKYLKNIPVLLFFFNLGREVVGVSPSDEQQVQVESTFKSAEETDDQTATIIVVIVLVVATVAPMATYFYLQRS